jgi:hypothetical protein
MTIPSIYLVLLGLWAIVFIKTFLNYANEYQDSQLGVNESLLYRPNKEATPPYPDDTASNIFWFAQVENLPSVVVCY